MFKNKRMSPKVWRIPIITLSSGEKVKLCTKCDLQKSIFSFYKNNKNKNGFETYCKDCKHKLATPEKRLEYQKRYRNKDPEKARAKWIIRTLKNKGETWQLTYEQIRKDMKENLKCPYCQDILNVNNLSYDHKDGKGSRVHPVCIACNLVKQIFHHDDFLKIVNLIGIDKLNMYKDIVKNCRGINKLESNKWKRGDGKAKERNYNNNIIAQAV